MARRSSQAPVSSRMTFLFLLCSPALLTWFVNSCFTGRDVIGRAASDHSCLSVSIFSPGNMRILEFPSACKGWGVSLAPAFIQGQEPCPGRVPESVLCIKHGWGFPKWLTSLCLCRDYYVPVSVQNATP